MPPKRTQGPKSAEKSEKPEPTANEVAQALGFQSVYDDEYRAFLAKVRELILQRFPQVIRGPTNLIRGSDSSAEFEECMEEVKLSDERWHYSRSDPTNNWPSKEFRDRALYRFVREVCKKLRHKSESMQYSDESDPPRRSSTTRKQRTMDDSDPPPPPRRSSQKKSTKPLPQASTSPKPSKQRAKPSPQASAYPKTPPPRRKLLIVTPQKRALETPSPPLHRSKFQKTAAPLPQSLPPPVPAQLPPPRLTALNPFVIVALRRGESTEARTEFRNVSTFEALEGWVRERSGIPEG